MSGFEIAGLVLGVFPLVQETAKGLRNVFADVQTWWRFETEFEAFVSAMETEHIKYSQNLEILLGELEIPEDDRNSLQNDPTCTLWYDLRIRAQLRQRIQDRYYDWFMRQLRDMNAALNSLHGILTYGKVYHLDSTSLESEMFRLKTSFSHAKDDLLTKVAHINKAIYEFLERASHVPNTKPSPRSKGAQTRPSLNVKNTANSLYKCFQRQLDCDCSSSHPCGVTVSRLESSRGRDTVYMRMFFWEGTARTQVKIESIMETASQPEPVASKFEEVAKLKQQASIRNRIGGMRKKTPKTIFALAASSIPAFNSFSRQPDKPKWKSPEEKQQKSLRFRLSTLIATKETELPVREVDETYVAAHRAVRFAGEDEPSSSQSTTDIAAIHDLCSTIKGKSCQPSLGYLQSTMENRLHLNLDPADQEPIQRYEMETIEHFLNTTPRRDTRIRVGYDLALAIINLGGSPWIPNSWNKTDIFLVRDPANPVPQPYLSHSSLRQTLLNTQHNSAAKKARSTLFALGVLLLELVFREKLENQPFRTRLMGNDGTPNEETDFATALLWQQRVEEEFGDELADAIKRCLVCMFDLAPAPDLGSSVFVQAVWQQVVLPVDKFLSAWRRV